MKLSRGGLILCGIYTAISLLLFAIRLSSDFKGKYILGQLAVAPAEMLFTFTGLIEPLVEAFPWMNNYYVFFAISLLIIYVIGWGFGSLASLSAGKGHHRDPN